VSSASDLSFHFFFFDVDWSMTFIRMYAFGSVAVMFNWSLNRKGHGNYTDMNVQ
jgi:hypothetical protein